MKKFLVQFYSDDLDIEQVMDEEFSESYRSFGRTNTSKKKFVQIDPEVLTKNLDDYIRTLGNVLENLGLGLKNYSLDEFEVSLGLTSKGGITLIGSVEIGASTTFKLKFKKNSIDE